MGSGANGQTELGRRLRAWRRGRGITQLDLAIAAGTTARYVSFVETGRSRPGADVVLRLAKTLELPNGAIDELLHLAGLPPTTRPPTSDDDAARERAALDTIASRHDPYPACLVDGLGCVRSANRAYLSLVPDALTLSPEDIVDRFFGEAGRQWIVDWPSIAWREADRRLHRAQERGDAEAIALALRALDHLRDTPRPEASLVSEPLRIRINPELVLSVQTVVLRLDGPRGPSADELQLELSIPADAATRQWFVRRRGGEPRVSER